MSPLVALPTPFRFSDPPRGALRCIAIFLCLTAGSSHAVRSHSSAKVPPSRLSWPAGRSYATWHQPRRLSTISSLVLCFCPRIALKSLRFRHTFRLLSGRAVNTLQAPMHISLTSPFTFSTLWCPTSLSRRIVDPHVSLA